MLIVCGYVTSVEHPQQSLLTPKQTRYQAYPNTALPQPSLRRHCLTLLAVKSLGNSRCTEPNTQSLLLFQNMSAKRKGHDARRLYASRHGNQVSKSYSFLAPKPTPLIRQATYSNVETKTRQPVRSCMPRKLLPFFNIDPATGVPMSSPKEAMPKEKPYIYEVRKGRQQFAKTDIPACCQD